MNKKFPLSIIAMVLLIPAVAHAVWWNPFTWFKKKPVIPPVIEQPLTAPTSPTVAEPKQETKEAKKTPSTNKAPKPTEQSAVQTVPVVTPTPIAPKPIELSIEDIEINQTYNSAQITWNTNIKAESKVILGGKEYVSSAGVGTDHSVIITGLTSDLKYQGYVTAVSNNAWVSEDITFTTKKAPEPIKQPDKNEETPGNASA